MGTISILGDEVLQITPDPIADNASELIPKRNITGVYPLKFQQRGVGDTDWTYPFDTITKLRFQIKYGKKIKSVDIELQTVSNQSTWNTGTLGALKTAQTEVNNWLDGEPIINKVLLLDAYPGASVAYSVRKLREAQVYALRVRRSSDNTEADIGFVGENFDNAALTVFCGAGDGYLAKVYDQSLNANDWVQATALNQPKIYSSGSINMVNMFPAIIWDGLASKLEFTTPISSAIDFTLFQVTKTAPGNEGVCFTNSGVTSNPYACLRFSDDKYYVKSRTDQFVTVADPIPDQVLLTSLAITAAKIYKNGIDLGAVSTGSSADADFNNGGSRGTAFSSGYGQEFVLYPSDKTTSRLAIELNINNYFQIY